MSIYVNADTKVIVQGITGSAGLDHTREMIKYGTNIVGGVTPGRGGEKVLDVPVFNTVEDAVKTTGATVTIIYVPAAFATDAIMETTDAGLELAICITEHIPIKDMVKVKEFMKGKNTRLIGPNCPGIITADETKIGIMPGYIHTKGHIGVVSRSGTLTYEAVHQLSQAGYGQTTAVGIGAGFVPGVLDEEAYDEVMQVTNEEAYGAARQTAKREGILGGVSSGAAISAAIKVANKLGKGKKVLAILPDNGERYLSTPLYEEEE